MDIWSSTENFKKSKFPKISQIYYLQWCSTKWLQKQNKATNDPQIFHMTITYINENSNYFGVIYIGAVQQNQG